MTSSIVDVAAGPRVQGRFPGFDGLRLIAAVLVMFSHAFLMATGTEEREPLVRVLGPGHVLGVYAVFTFFIISGFLLAGSLAAKASPATYVVHRTLRIVPGFVFSVIVTAFVIGPLCSSLGVTTYFKDPSVYVFLRTSLETLGASELPGVFDYPDRSGLAGVVNGSLWSLRYEALSYVLLLLVWATVSTSDRLAGVFVVAGLCAWLFPSASFLTSVEFTLPYFAAGVGMHAVHRRFGTTGYGAWIAVALLVVAGWLGVTRYAFAPLGAYVLVFLGQRVNPVSWLVARMGDCSYGIYLFAWPCQQVVKQVTGTTSPMGLFVMAAPLAVALAVVSCYLVEAPAMRWRGPVTRWARQHIAALLDHAGGGRPAAVRAARATFVVAAAAVLAVGPWWLVFESLAIMAAWTVAGALTGALVYHAVTPLWRRA